MSHPPRGGGKARGSLKKQRVGFCYWPAGAEVGRFGDPAVPAGLRATRPLHSRGPDPSMIVTKSGVKSAAKLVIAVFVGAAIGVIVSHASSPASMGAPPNTSPASGLAAVPEAVRAERPARHARNASLGEGLAEKSKSAEELASANELEGGVSWSECADYCAANCNKYRGCRRCAEYDNDVEKDCCHYMCNRYTGCKKCPGAG